MKRLLLLLLLLPSLSFAHYNQGDKVVLLVIPGCFYCEEAKQDLQSHHIPYKAVFSTESDAYPQLYVNDQYIGTGSDAVDEWINN